MNLGKLGVQREREAISSSLPKIGNKTGLSALQVLIFIVIAIIVMGVSILFGAYRGCIDGSPDISEVNIMPMGYASFVYDADGNAIQKLNSASGNRVSVSIAEIPLDMQHAIVAIEDSRFYEHSGVDPHGMIRALAVAIRTGFSRSEGASTITQQLLKNNMFTEWTSESRLSRNKRKLQEQHLAVALERSLTESGRDAKSVILENYLNTVNFGAGTYGVQTAAQTYFGKDCKDLTLSECAVLAAIPQNPSRWNPKTHPDWNAQRAETVLDYMLEQGYITQQQHDDALADDVYERIQETSSNSANAEVYSYFVDEVISQVKRDLMEQKGYTEVQANNAIYSSGLKIYSTEDASIQKIMEEEFSNSSNFPGNVLIGLEWALTLDKANGTRENYSREMMQQYFRQENPDFNLVFNSEYEAQHYIDLYKEAVINDGDNIVGERTSFVPQPQAAMTVIDQKTGYVKGIVGGRGDKKASLTLNRATDSYRQPGSTFKPLSTYGPALDLHKITLATTVLDEPYKYTSGREVNNADGEYHGDITIREALRISDNVVAVKVLTDITPAVGFNYLEELGFSQLVDDETKDVTQALSLGGITNGVSNLELTAAYAAIANGGTYTTPIFYTKVVDREGNILLENTPLSENVFSESTCYLLTNAMEDVVKEGTGVDFQLKNGMPVAGKTGTTSSYKDLEFAGFTPYYTAAIWAGYDTSAEIPVEYRQYYKTLWTNVMNRIHANLTVKQFEQPDSVQEFNLCDKSGLLVGRGCKATSEIFAVGTEPTEECRQHIPVVTPRPTRMPTPAPVATQPDTAQTETQTQPAAETPPADTAPADTAPADTAPPADTGEATG